jgi:uncharacterized membrane protein YeaQ/YmgE (transglycosylase-associated protein family)
MAELTNLLVFLLIGLIAGWLAGQIMKGSGFGPLGDLAVGVVGAVIGGYVFSRFMPPGLGILGSIICATAGACLLLFVIKLARRG